MDIEVVIADDAALQGHTLPRAGTVVARALDSLGITPGRIVTVQEQDEKALAARVKNSQNIIVLCGFEGDAARLASHLPEATITTFDLPQLSSALLVATGSARMYLLPRGEPDMEAHLEAHILPSLHPGKAQHIESVEISLFGPTMDELRAAASDIKGRHPATDFLCADSFPELRATLRARGASRSLAQEPVREAADELTSRFGKAIHSLEGKKLAHVAADALRATGHTVAVFETGGEGVARGLTGHGEPCPLVLGLCVPGPGPAADLLGIEELSPQAIVKAGLELSGADLAVATAATTGPKMSAEANPIGLVHCALASERDCWNVERAFGPQAREKVEKLCAATAYSAILEWCRGNKS